MKPNKIHLERLLINRYAHLLAVIVISILCLPFLSHLQFPLGISPIEVLFVFAVIATIRAVIPEKKKLKLYIAVALTGFGLDIISHALPSGWNILGGIFSVLASIIFATFLFCSILVIIKLLFQSRDISLDTILGGVCVYFLLGILWSILFNLLNIIRPETFPGVERLHILYFSFTTLTTLGYGDITPGGELAMILAILEAVVGQMYVAIFIARLVGLHIVSETMK